MTQSVHVFLLGDKNWILTCCIYVDHLNTIGIPDKVHNTFAHLKNEFEMRELGMTNLVLSYKIEHLLDNTLVH